MFFIFSHFKSIKITCIDTGYFVVVARGTFVEFRNGMLNICPVGRSCTQAERDQFAEFDKEHHIRNKLVEDFKKEFPDAGLSFVQGMQKDRFN